MPMQMPLRGAPALAGNKSAHAGSAAAAGTPPNQPLLAPPALIAPIAPPLPLPDTCYAPLAPSVSKPPAQLTIEAHAAERRHANGPGKASRATRTVKPVPLR